MSGRDLRTFLCSHRSGTFHTALHSDTGTGTVPRITPANYGEIMSSLKQQKDSSGDSLQRFKMLSKRGKQTQETTTLRKHREVWKKEHDRLANLKTKVQTDLNIWRADILSRGLEYLPNVLTELTVYESQLHDEREEFERVTINPVWNLRTDLRSLIEDSTCPEADQTALEAHEEILKELKVLKEHQNTIQKLLDEECEMVSMELEDFESCWGLCLELFSSPTVRGIPAEVNSLDCPDDKFRTDTLREFQRLDDQFQMLLDEWRQRNKHVLDLTYGGWTKNEAERFVHILEQYSHTVPNRRPMYLDRVMREFPYKTRKDVVEHESWYMAIGYYHSVKQGYLDSWELNKRELVHKVAKLFAQVKEMIETQEIARTARELQKQTCDRLYQKVRAWRMEKLKDEQVRTEEAARFQTLEEKQRKFEEEKCLRKRTKEKVQIKQYHTELSTCLQEERQQAQRLQAEVKKEREEQTVRNVQRVEYRKGKYSEKMAETKEAQTRAITEEREKELRLEQLRQQVRVNVCSDPDRVLRDTKASNARLTAQQNTELELQQPLYKLQTFPANKITSDPRIRLETALREAGLHKTAYGRRILMSIAPPIKPRPDQESSLFKD